jgi:hypothetical protein
MTPMSPFMPTCRRREDSPWSSARAIAASTIHPSIDHRSPGTPADVWGAAVQSPEIELGWWARGSFQNDYLCLIATRSDDGHNVHAKGSVLAPGNISQLQAALEVSLLHSRGDTSG